MKIDFIVSTLMGGGAERVVALMANNLAKSTKYDISVITLYSGIDAYDINPEIKRVRLKKSKFIPTQKLSSFYNLIIHYKNKNNRPDIIISFITLTNLICIVVANLYSIKIIVQEHNSYLRFNKSDKLLTDITRKYYYKKADLLTVLTSFDIPYYEKYGANVTIMPNPCSFISITENSHARENTILAVGNLNRYHHKGFDTLINLMVPIFNKHPEWILKIAGSGDDGLRYLSDLALKNNILDKIIFTGYVTNISKIMHESSIFILSSRYEGLPMVLLEALSQGMACISFDCLTGPSDIIKNYENGILIEDQNIEKMQEGIYELIEHSELRNKLANEGVKSLDKFNILEITKKYEELFNKLTNES